MDNQRVLLLQHVQINPPGLVGEALRQHQVPYDIVQVSSERLPDPTPYSAIVSFGGTQHVYEEGESRYRYLQEEELLLRHAVAQQLPVLGICLGSQILAHAFGGDVHPQPPMEIGFLHVHISEIGRQDPLFRGFPGYEQAFQWHEDIFDPPPGSTVLASHSSGKHHVFKIGPHAYGLQHHVELTAQILEHWLTDPDSRNEFIKNRGIYSYAKILNERPQLYLLYHDHSCLLIENFLRLSKLIE